MPRDNNGNTTPLPGLIVSTGDTIVPSQHNPFVNDMYSMMSQSLSRDGQGGMRANLNMYNHKITGLAPGTDDTDAATVSQINGLLPVGVIVDFGGRNAPTNWLFCDGQAVSVSTYPALTDAIYCGDSRNATASFGYRTTSQTNPSANRITSGTYIVLPDYRGRVTAAPDNMGGVDSNRLDGYEGRDVIGGEIGEAFHTLTVEEIPEHNHGGQTSEDGNHQHIYGLATNPPGGPSSIGGTTLGRIEYVNCEFAGIHRHTISSQGGGERHINVQPTLMVNKIIKVL